MSPEVVRIDLAKAAADQAASKPRTSNTGSKSPTAATKSSDNLENKCRHCGNDPTTDPAHPSLEDLAEFTKTIWSGKDFHKAYDLYGGVVRIEFRNISADELMATQRATLADNAKDDSGGLIGAFALFDRAEEYQMALAVHSLIVGERVYTPVTTPREAADEVRKISGNQVIYQTIRDIYREFAKLMRNIIAMSRDPSFSRATPPGGSSAGSPTTATPA